MVFLRVDLGSGFLKINFGAISVFVSVPVFDVAVEEGVVVEEDGVIVGEVAAGSLFTVDDVGLTVVVSKEAVGAFVALSVVVGFVVPEDKVVFSTGIGTFSWVVGVVFVALEFFSVMSEVVAESISRVVVEIF